MTVENQGEAAVVLVWHDKHFTFLVEESDEGALVPDMADVEKAANLARHRDKEKDYTPRF